MKTEVSVLLKNYQIMKNYKSHTLKAVDNAGNVTELMVYAGA